MRQLCYVLLVCLLFGEGIISHAYSGEAHATGKDSQMMIVKEAAEDAKEISIRKDEFDEIVGQLQGMKAILEDMRRDYDARLTEMQTKIATLEKENRELQKEKTESSSLPAEITGDDREVGENGLSSLQDTTDANQSPASETGQWSPAQPITLWGMGKSYMNISFDGLFAAAGSTAKDIGTLEPGGHDPNQRGFTVQNLETTFDGAVDPYFKGQANIIFQIDKAGESFLEVEEAFLTSTSLPLNLQVKAGTFFTEFGRLNPFHPHAWDFADQPLVNGRFLGPDGLRGPGARLSWLAPTSNYTELFFTVQDSQGETAHSFRNEEALFGREAVETRVRSMEDMLYTPRITTSFEVTDETTVLLGTSAAFGPNSTGTDKDTLIYGLDMFWKWKSEYAAGGFPFVTWQTEVMGRRFEAGEDANAGLPNEVMHNWGTYTQICWGFKKRWVAGLRGDYADGEEEAVDPLGFERWRLSPNLTFYPSEFSKMRLQYNYDDILGNESSEHSVMLQFEFLLGSHGAHKF